jgi:putative transposase
VSDALACGRRFCLLNVIDDYSRECLACIVDPSPSGRRVVWELTAIAEHRLLPCIVVSANAVLSEVEGGRVDQTRCPRLVSGHPRRMALYRAGQAAAGRLRGIFKGRLRDECLNEHPFPSLAAARRIIEAWRTDYNIVRPHSSLGGMAPAEFTNSPRQGQEGTEANLAAD